MNRFEGRSVIVTGAAQGIGKAIASGFANEGAHAILTDINADAVEKVASELNDGGSQCEAASLDIADVDGLNAFFDDLVGRIGRLDVLINNAGITKDIDFFSVKEADWRQIFEVNAQGTFFCMQAAARHMREARHGKIVNISSIGGKGWKGTSNVAYASSKGAIVTMTRVAASTLGPFNVNVNAVCPGLVRTEMFVRMMQERADRLGITEQEATENQSADIPLKRAEEPEDIADMALFLASDQANQITGQSINVDGGLVWD